MKKTIILLIAILACAFLYAQDEYTLKYTFKKGATRTLKIITDGDLHFDYSENKSTSAMKFIIVATYKITDVSENGNATIELNFDRYDVGEKNNKSSSNDVKLLPKLKYTITPSGRQVGKLEFVGGQDMPGMDPNIYLNGLPAWGLALPETPIKVGDSWEVEANPVTRGLVVMPENARKIKMRYTLESVDKYKESQVYKINTALETPCYIQESIPGGKNQINSSIILKTNAIFMLGAEGLDIISGDGNTDMEVKYSVISSEGQQLMSAVITGNPKVTISRYVPEIKPLKPEPKKEVKPTPKPTPKPAPKPTPKPKAK